MNGTDLSDVLRVRDLGGDRFVDEPSGGDGVRVFGGQTLARALLACGATVDPGRVPASLHCYFLREGRPEVPVTYGVDRDRDGGGHSFRRVVADQAGTTIFTMAAVFRTRRGRPWQGGPTRPPVGASLEDLAAAAPVMPALLPLDLRTLRPPEDGSVFPPSLAARAPDDAPLGPLLAAAALAYLSDFSTALPQRSGARVLGPTLDHSLWFHGEPRWEGWVRIDLTAGQIGPRSGWYTGELSDESGATVASLAQEAVYRAAPAAVASTYAEGSRTGGQRPGVG